jgi:tetratricopeptide (TPR) repeat protein/CHAT domain-containing protein
MIFAGMMLPVAGQDIQLSLKYKSKADDLVKKGLYLEAIVYYDSAATAELKNASPFLPFVAGCYEKAANCFIDAGLISGSIPYYDLALRNYSKAGNTEKAISILTDINGIHNEIINLDLLAPWGNISLLQVIEVHFRIKEVTGIQDGTVSVVLNAGDNDGIFIGARGEALGVHSSDTPNRDNLPLGTAEVVTSSANQSEVLINLIDLASEYGQVYAGDMVRLPARLPVIESPSIFMELANLNIDFLDISSEPLYHPRHLIYFDSPELESVMLKKMQDDILETLELIRPLAADEPSWTAPAPSGRFRGLNMIEAMEKTQPADILAFLEFVNSYPGIYMGHSWKINETYATWIIHNCPISGKEMRDLLQAAETDAEFRDILLTYKKDLIDGDFPSDWQGEAEDLAEKGRFDEALSLNTILFRVADMLDSTDLKGWAHFSKGNILDDKQEYENATSEFIKARELFIQTGNLKGASYATNNLAMIQNALGNYNEAYLAYEASSQLKEKQLETDMSSDMKESMARSLEGMGNSLYNMDRYDEALVAYQEAGRYYKSANTLSGLRDEADINGWIGEVYSKTGDYRESLKYYQDQLVIYQNLGDQAGEADALDNIAYILSLQGDIRESNRLYQQAYELKISLDNKDGAGFSKSNVGQTYWTLGGYENAIQAHEEAIRLRTEANNRKGQAYSWHKLGDLYLKSGDPKKSMDAFDKAAALYSEINDKNALADVYSSIGDTYYDVKDYPQAVIYYSKAASIFEELLSMSSYAETLTDIGNAWYNDKNYQKARECFEKSLSIQHGINDRSGQIYNYINLGLIGLYFDINYPAAEQYMQQALSLAKEVENEYYTAYCSFSLGGLFSTRGKPDEAVRYYDQALDTYRKIGDQVEICNTLISKAFHYSSQGLFDEARKLFDEAFIIAEQTNNRNLQSLIYSGMGEINRLTGEFSKSLETMNKSLRIYQEVDNSWGIASAYINLGNTYNALSDFQTAIAYYQKADSIYALVGSDLSRATPINNIGTIYYFQGDQDKALAQFRAALPLVLKMGVESDFHALLEANIAEVFYEMKQYDSAYFWLEGALNKALQFNNKHRLASTLIISGKLNISTGHYDEAFANLDKAEQLLIETGEKDMQTELYFQRGRLNYETKRYDVAIEDLTTSVDISKNIGYTKYLWGSLYQMAVIYKEQGNSTESIRLLKEAVEILEATGQKVAGGDEAKKIFESTEARLKVYEMIVQLLIQENRVDEALLYLEKANNSNLQMKFGSIERSYADPSRNDAIYKEKELKANMDQVSTELVKEKSKPDELQNAALISKLEEVEKVAEEEYNMFVRNTVTSYPDLRNYFSNSVNPNEFSSAKRNIPPDMAVILYLLGDSSLYIFAATRDTIFANVLEMEKSMLEKKVLDLYALISRPSFKTTERGSRTLVTADEAVDNETKFMDISNELYSILVSPIYDRISDKDYLVIIPNGVLNYLPFQVLGTRQQDRFRYMAEDFRISYTNKLQFGMAAPEGKTIKIVALGNADRTLPFAGTEVVMIKSMYPDALVYVEDEASREIVYNIPDNYNILHFATHGILDYNKFENSYLVLASKPELNDDGRFRIEDIYKVENLGMYDMVTLSACETAVSFELLEGWPVTTASAFLETGVTTVVASLWSVDDKATNTLMRNFYTNLKTMDKLDALNKAQIDMIHTTEYAHPYYWAPFMLVGSWR